LPDDRFREGLAIPNAKAEWPRWVQEITMTTQDLNSTISNEIVHDLGVVCSCLAEV
jgi:hypothetical protein